MARMSATRATITGVVALIPAGLGAFFIAIAQSQTTPPESIWGNVWTRVAVGCWGVAVVVVAAGLLSGRRDEGEAKAAPPRTIEDEAADLARELLAFYEPWATGLPPIEYVKVGQAPAGALAEWESQRDATILAEYRRVFAARVERVYETLRDKRGYGHPQMDGRYKNLRLAGEVFTIARALGQMVGVEITMAESPKIPNEPASAEGPAQPTLRSQLHGGRGPLFRRPRD